jgi:phosphoribosylglycinamide formyltransferase-1
VKLFRIGVLASGGGSNLQALLDRKASGDLPVEFAFVAGNNSKALAFDRARKTKVPHFHISSLTEGSEALADQRLAELCCDSKIDLLVLAGYMKLIGPALLGAMPNRIVNIHPALLPAFGGPGYYGGRIHAAVIARGCAYTGVTIHMVNGNYDEGQILLQRVVRVLPGDSADDLGARVLVAEHDSYWRVISGFARGILQSQPVSDLGDSLAVEVQPEFVQEMKKAFANREIHG